MKIPQASVGETWTAGEAGDIRQQREIVGLHSLSTALNPERAVAETSCVGLQIRSQSYG